jgi:hypothetical protein
MFREVVLFIAFRACSGKSLIWGQNPFQYRNAIRLIAVSFIIHFFQLLSLVKKNIFISIEHASTTQYLIFIGACVLCTYGIEQIFSKKVLARATRIYKESPIATYSKLIAFGYLIVNLIILSAIINLNR